jgi:putative transposase
MIDEPVQPRRRLLRLDGYDYAQTGVYFVTVCVQDRACLFGRIIGGAMHLNVAGELAAEARCSIPAQFSGVEIDAFVVMPNHLHGIIVIADEMSVGAPLVGARLPTSERAATRAAPTDRDHDDDANRPANKRPTVGGIVGGFKSSFTVEYIRGVKAGRWSAFDRRVWQRKYYEHVVRDEADLARIRRYIEENPLRWEFDHDNPARNKP